MMICRLSQRTDLAVATAALMTQIWPEHYGPGGDGDARADVLSRIKDDRAAIAVSDGDVVGTVALSEVSFGAQGEGPWLVGLCTTADLRGQGIGSMLTTWAMGMARQQGRSALYTTTQDAAGIMTRLGWTQTRTITEDAGAWTVWKVELRDNGSNAT